MVRRWLWIGVVPALLVAGLLLAVHAAGRPARPAPSGRPAACLTADTTAACPAPQGPVAAWLPFAAERMPARQRLLLAAAGAAPVPADRLAGVYSHIRLRRWVGGDEGARDSERWRAADGSGLLAEGRTGKGSKGSANITEYPAGALPLPVAEPFPADPATLRRQLSGENDPGELRTTAGGDPGLVVTRLLDLVGLRYLDRAERATVLRLLAELPGLAAAEPAGVPAADPTALTFGLEFDGTRLTFAVRAGSGEILGWQYGDAERVAVLIRSREPQLPARPGGRTGSR